MWYTVMGNENVQIYIGRVIIRKVRKANKDKQAEKRLDALELRASGKSAEEACTAGFHPAYIAQLIRKYQQGRIEAIAGNQYGRNRKNMTKEENHAFAL